MAIYNIETDEITTTTPSEGRVEGDSPSMSSPQQTEGANQSPLQQQLTQLEADRKQALADTQSSYDAFLQSLDEEGNAIDALTSTVKKRKVVDPEQMRVRRNIANLYDALQLTGALAGMATGGRGTIGTPAQLTSATTTNNTLAERLQEQQRQADNAYTEALANMTHRQQTARANLNKQRLQASNNFERAKQDINKHYDTQTRLINEGEAKRKHAYNLAVMKENNKIEMAQKRLKKQGVKKAEEIIPYDNAYYKIDPQYNTALSYEAYEFAQRYYIDMSDFKRNSGSNSKNASAALILSALNGTLPLSDEDAAQAYKDALKIFNSYFVEVNPGNNKATENTTPTKTDIPGFSTSTSSTGKITIPGF